MACIHPACGERDVDHEQPGQSIKLRVAGCLKRTASQISTGARQLPRAEGS